MADEGSVTFSTIYIFIVIYNILIKVFSNSFIFQKLQDGNSLDSRQCGLVYRERSSKHEILFLRDLSQSPVFPVVRRRCGGVERSVRGSDISISCHISFSGRSPRPRELSAAVTPVDISYWRDKPLNSCSPDDSQLIFILSVYLCYALPVYFSAEVGLLEKHQFQILVHRC